MTAPYSNLILNKLKRFLLAVVVIIFFVLLASTLLLILNDREQQLDNHGRSMESLAVILSKEADATLTLASTILEELKRDIKVDSAGAFINPRDIHLSLLRSRSFINSRAGSPSFSHLFVLDKDGFNVANSVSHPVKRVNASDREYFIHHHKQPGNRLYISQPGYSKVTDERVIFLTSRIEEASGSFCGIIGIQLKLSHFDSMYQLLNLPPGGTVTLLRSDGKGIYRFPLVDDFFNQTIADKQRFRHMLLDKSGFITNAASPYDGYQRVLGYRLSERYPVLNIISITQHSALQHWQQQAIRNLSLSIAAGMVLLLLAFFTYRQLQHLSTAINLSTRDPLTSIHNRRAFDKQLEQEWRRAERRGGVLSILFIDIDHFKLYNDNYGHSAGDHCLSKVAKCLASCANRSGEMVARYGGEEFIALLPDCDEIEAMHTAERMQVIVADLRIPHEHSPIAPYITISIGIATSTVSQQAPAEQLIKRADQALYQAKNEGRNQIRVNDNNVTQ